MRAQRTPRLSQHIFRRRRWQPPLSIPEGGQTVGERTQQTEPSAGRGAAWMPMQPEEPRTGCRGPIGQAAAGLHRRNILNRPVYGD